jgi:hypothetical protein
VLREATLPARAIDCFSNDQPHFALIESSVFVHWAALS